MRQREFLRILGQLSRLNPNQRALFLSRLAQGLGEDPWAPDIDIAEAQGLAPVAVTLTSAPGACERDCADTDADLAIAFS